MGEDYAGFGRNDEGASIKGRLAMIRSSYIPKMTLLMLLSSVSPLLSDANRTVTTVAPLDSSRSLTAIEAYDSRGRLTSTKLPNEA